MAKSTFNSWPWPKPSPIHPHHYLEHLAREKLEINMLLEQGGMSENIREMLVDRLKRIEESRAAAETYYEQN